MIATSITRERNMTEYTLFLKPNLNSGMLPV